MEKEREKSKRKHRDSDHREPAAEAAATKYKDVYIDGGAKRVRAVEENKGRRLEDRVKEEEGVDAISKDEVGSMELLPATASTTSVDVPLSDTLSKAKRALQMQKELKKIPSLKKDAGQRLAGKEEENKAPPTSSGLLPVDPTSGNSSTATEGNQASGLPHLLKRAQELAAEMRSRQDPEFVPLINMFPGQDVAVQPKPPKAPLLRLDALGSEIDEYDSVMNIPKVNNLSTLKVNINKQKKDAFQKVDPDKNPHFDPLEPWKPKVNMSNLMRVLNSEAPPQDPTRLEMEIRTGFTGSERFHMDRNIARKLTPAERREKKLFNDPKNSETVVSVYKMNNLPHLQALFKIDAHAHENKLTGCAVISEGISVVVVEGCPKSIKRYGKVMLRRIDWASSVKKEEGEDKAHDAPVNKCLMVWEGNVAKPSFHRFSIQDCRTEAGARKIFADAGVANYWELAVNFTEDQM